MDMSIWRKSDCRSFNGCVQTCIHGEFEYGIFEERHYSNGEKWSLRKRPVNRDGEATDSWGYTMCGFTSKRDTIAHFQKYILKELAI